MRKTGVLRSRNALTIMIAAMLTVTAFALIAYVPAAQPGAVIGADEGPADVGPVYTITVVGGTINGASTGTFSPGDEVTITADEAPEGQRFKGWTIEGTGGIEELEMLKGLVIPGKQIIFTIPDSDPGVDIPDDLTVTLTAVFEDRPAGSAVGDTVLLTVAAFAVILICIVCYALLIRRP